MWVSRLAATAAAVLALALGLSLAGCSPRILRVVEPQDPVLAGLVGWWRFEEGLGSAVAHDASGNGNDGTIRGLDVAADVTWPPGWAGTALELRGAGYVEVPRSPSIDDIVDEVTVAAWVYLEGSVDPIDLHGTAISREIGNTDSQHYHLSLFLDEAPKLFITTATTGAVPKQDPMEKVPRFNWVHLAGTYDGALAKLYVGGLLVTSLPVTGAFAPDTTPLIVGGNGNGTPLGITERFPGRLDEVMLYKRALGPDEIRKLSGQ